MTPRDFAAWVTGYYGPWPKGQQEDIAAYLSGLSSGYLESLREVIKRTFPSQYGKVPDVAALETAKGAALDIHCQRIDPTLKQLEMYDPKPEDDSELMVLDWSKILRERVGRMA